MESKKEKAVTLLPNDVIELVLSAFAAGRGSHTGVPSLKEVEHVVGACRPSLSRENVHEVLKAWVVGKWNATSASISPPPEPAVLHATLNSLDYLCDRNFLDLLDLDDPEEAWYWMSTITMICGGGDTMDAKAEIASDALPKAVELDYPKKLLLVQLLVEEGGAQVRTIYDTQEEPEEYSNAANVAIDRGELEVARYLWQNRHRTGMDKETLESDLLTYAGPCLDNPLMMEFLVKEMDMHDYDEKDSLSICNLSGCLYGTALMMMKLTGKRNQFYEKEFHNLAYSALKDRNTDAARNIIDACASEGYPTAFMAEPRFIEMTANMGFVEGMELVIAEIKRSGAPAPNYGNALANACLHGHLEAIRILVREGAVPTSEAVKNALSARSDRGTRMVLDEILPHMSADNAHTTKVMIQTIVTSYLNGHDDAVIYVFDYLTKTGLLDMMDNMVRLEDERWLISSAERVTGSRRLPIPKDACYYSQAAIYTYYRTGSVSDLRAVI